jgi:hypothetical protein
MSAPASRWILLDLVLVVGIGASAWIALDPVLTTVQARSARKERAAGEQALTRELDLAYYKKKHYNPGAPTEAAWYGFSPSSFPPGPRAPWVSDARWNRLAHRPATAGARYGIYTEGTEAWLLIYDDADRDGVPSRELIHLAEGRRIERVAHRPEE